ncbi:uncharacterized protein LOC143208538 [Lasioglossum baleicum]|uniref:uncharacterized protein LOC143208538 n=1 Tax=Lasioglossum baleicum TaxID=434251 RepID=UPI003FCC3CF3
MPEPKRGCCAHTYSPAETHDQDYRYQSPSKKPQESCDLRKCKYAKLQAETTFSNTQKLLDKIQKLKKSIQDLEAKQSYNKVESNRQRDVLSQTNDFSVTDLKSARQVLNNCMAEIGKLKNFMDDDNCWWKMFKKMEFNCCDQKAPHLHGYLDGTMITLKLMEEGKNFVASTPKSSLVMTGDRDDRRTYITGRSKTNRVLQYTGTDGEYEGFRRYKDSSIGPASSVEISIPFDSCQKQCPTACIPETRSAKDTVTEKDAQYTHSNPVGLYEAFRRTSSSVRFPRDQRAERSSTDLLKRPKSTFSNENTPTKRVISVDMSTSMDLLQKAGNNAAATTSKKGVKSFMVKTFAPKLGKTQKRQTRSKKSETSQEESEAEKVKDQR